jgi:hypothetical protein
MKKLTLTAMALIAGATFVHAQGFLQLTSGTSFGITTNTGTLGNPTAPDSPYATIVSGLTLKSSTASKAFDYAFLFIPTGIGTSGDLSLAGLTDGNWEQLSVYNSATGEAGAALVGTNSASLGNFGAQGGANSVAAIGAANDAFNNGESYSIALVGWSANEGTSWSGVSTELSSGNWSALGNFGADFGSVDPTTGAPGSLPSGIWGNSTLVLYTVPVPEPTTLALAGLGGLSMLFLRRRK